MHKKNGESIKKLSLLLLNYKKSYTYNKGGVTGNLWFPVIYKF